MKILAVEFSSPQRSVAVTQSRTDGAAALGEAVETGGRGPNALAMIEAALRQAQLEREQIECLAIGLGPGSYTGIRSAIALAQGWELASGPGIKLLGVSSVDVIAAQAPGEGMTGRVAVVIDAQRNEFYVASYELGAGEPRLIERLRLATLAEVRERQQGGELIIGPEVVKWFPEGRTVFPRAATLGRLALGRNDIVSGERLEPIYLRETTFVKAPPARKMV